MINLELLTFPFFPSNGRELGTNPATTEGKDLICRSKAGEERKREIPKRNLVSPERKAEPRSLPSEKRKN